MRIDSSVLINKTYAISCCANCSCTIVRTVCTHVRKHLQFSQINKKFQSDVNKKLIILTYCFENRDKAIEKNCKMLSILQAFKNVNKI